jgi:hypothetical protein
MKYNAVKHTVAIGLEKSPDEVFDHLIQLKKWWPEDFEGEDLKLNSAFVLRTGDSHYSKSKVIELVPGKKLVWLTMESIRTTDHFDWTGTKMIFEVSLQGDHTLLKFTYDGVVLADESDRLEEICDITVKELFYNFLVNGKGK